MGEVIYLADRRPQKPLFYGYVDVNDRDEFVIGNHTGWLSTSGHFCLSKADPYVAAFPSMTQARAFMALAAKLGLAGAVLSLDEFLTPTFAEDAQ